MKKYLVILLISISVFSCKSQKLTSKLTEEEIVFIHTNDIHGNIDNLPRFAFMVDSIKKLYPNVFVLNAGDIFTGNPYVDMYQDKGFPVIDLMNDAGFDLTAIGNHEFDYGQEILAKRMEQAKFPFICGNMFNIGGSLQKPLANYQFKTRNGKVINVFSLIDNSANGLPESHPAKLKGLKFENALKIAPEFKNLREGASVFIALTHLGINTDIELAKLMPELDLIIGAHTHTVIDSGKMVNGVLICQVGARLKFLGETIVKIKDGKVSEKKTKLLPVSKSGSVDKNMEEKVKKYNNNPYFDVVLGQATTEMVNIEEIGCFITDAYRDYAKSDIAFQNSGGIRISEIEKGDITRGLIFKLDPFGNKLVVLDMKLDEIKSLIINSYINNEIDLRVSGINYNILTENGKAKDVVIYDYNGQLLSNDKTYKVSMNDYVINTYDFTHSESGSSSDVITAEILIEFLKKGALDYSKVKRTFIDKN